ETQLIVRSRHPPHDTMKALSGGYMKQLLLWTVICLLFSGALNAQNEFVTNTTDRTFFPRDTIWGYAQLDLAPPHNEIDPNLCAGNAGTYGGVNAPCTAFARYML